MDSAVGINAVIHCAGVRIKQYRPLPIENVGCPCQIIGVPVNLVKQTGGNPARAVDTGILRMVGGCPIQSSAKSSVPTPGKNHVEIPPGDVLESGVASVHIPAC